MQFAPRYCIAYMNSGRERAVLKSWFKNINLCMASESGFYYKLKDDEDWVSMGEQSDSSWRDVVRPIMQVS